MKKLEKRFKLNGFDYVQFKRNMKAAIYEQWLDDKLLSYEVFSIKNQKESSMLVDGIMINFEAKEIYPKDSAWGLTAWTEKTMAAAIKRFELLSA